MEAFAVLLVLALILIVVVLPIAAFVRSGRAMRETQQTQARIAALASELERLKSEQRRQSATPGTSVEQAVAAPASQPQSFPPSEPAVTAPARAVREAAPEHLPRPGPPPLPPIIPIPEAQRVMPRSGPEEAGPAAAPPSAPKPVFSFNRLKGNLDWEQFMGAKLFAWIGGLALFLGVAYFVRYSFEHDLIPPEVRVALGFLAGIGLVVAGVFIRRKGYSITAHTFCATGILILYAVTFACRAVYHFAFFGPAPTFALMTLISIAAFLLAVRLQAQVVAILGMLGGFLTPVLLSTGQDAPVALFSYIALLDAALLAVALRQRWFYLASLAAAGTVVMLVGWVAEFFEREQYFLGNKVLLPMAVLLLFNGLWLGAAKLARKRHSTDWHTSISAVAIAAVAFAFAFYLVSFESFGKRPWLLFSFAFLIDIGVLGLSRLDRRLGVAHPLAGAAIFLLLAVWLGSRLSNELLPAALVFTLVFAAFHSLLPVVLPPAEGAGLPLKVILLFPPLALLVLLIPVFGLAELTVFIWPAILLVDLVAIALAALAGSVVPVLIVLILTLIAAAGVLFRIPSELTGLPTLLLVVGVCAVLFAMAGVWLGRRLSTDQASAGGEKNLNDRLVAHLPSFGIVLPFALLIMMVGRLQLANPSPVFGLALLLVGLLFAVTFKFGFEWLPLIGLACVAALEYAWQLRLFSAEVAWPVLAWYAVFFAVFGAFPFATNRFNAAQGPWFAAALAGPVQFYLVYQLVKVAWPNPVMGLLPAAFAVLALFSLVGVTRRVPAGSPVRLTLLALFGGVALLFITLVFPIQFDREWLTIAWALEGAALCWLFHRVPHPGLRLTGVGLLVVAFCRLALNPAVLGYHARSTFPIVNWYLYTYGLVIVSLYAGARLLAPPRERVLQIHAPALLYTLGTVLAFLLMNIQIADFFTEPGAETLTFKFSGNFARDMTYSIAWALFALVLLVVGLIRQIRLARYAALGLLGVTLVKLFFHDLANLKQLYRIGALIGVAIIAIVASFLYQRFVAKIARPDEPASLPTES